MSDRNRAIADSNINQFKFSKHVLLLGEARHVC